MDPVILAGLIVVSVILGLGSRMFFENKRRRSGASDPRSAEYQAAVHAKSKAFVDGLVWTAGLMIVAVLAQSQLAATLVLVNRLFINEGVVLA